MDRLHATYKFLTRSIINDKEVETNLVACYEKYAKASGVYDPKLYNEAVTLSNRFMPADLYTCWIPLLPI